MKTLFLMLLPLLLGATTLESVIDKALASHISLEVIQERINAEDYTISATRSFYNPEISFGVNDIQFDDPLDRSREPMQTASVNIKQKIPSFGKRDAKTDRSRARKNQIVLTLEAAKVKLVEAIKVTAYHIWEVNQELNITQEYIAVTKQNIELHTAYSATRDNSHMGMMSAELTLSQLKIKKSRYTSKRKALFAKLEYLAGESVDDLEIVLDVTAPKPYGYYAERLGNNLSYSVTSSEVMVAQREVQVKDSEGDVDPYVQVGYYYREDFKDYVNVSFGMALPIYGSESDNTESARKSALSKSAASQDFMLKLQGELGGRYAALEDAYAIAKILTDESMPQLEHMFELTNASVKNGQDLFVYIDLLKQKLSLDEQLIEATTQQHTTEAALDALIGETK